MKSPNKNAGRSPEEVLDLHTAIDILKSPFPYLSTSVFTQKLLAYTVDVLYISQTQSPVLPRDAQHKYSFV